MLDTAVRSKLQSLKQLPMLPTIAAEALQLIDNSKTSAGRLGKIIERDQALAARVLRVANSPFYGFPREISTIDLAIVILGFNAIREIILSLVVQGVLLNVRSSDLKVSDFWKYSVFSGCTARFLARKLGYRLAGEAFVAGLMHDIGVLIIAQYFQRELQDIRRYQKQHGGSMHQAERACLGATHAEVGAWLAEQWNLPEQLIHAIRWHHEAPPEPGQDNGYAADEADSAETPPTTSTELEDIRHPLTALVALTEWFAYHLGFKEWARDALEAPLNLSSGLLGKVGAHDVLEPESAIEALKPILLEEFAKGAVFGAVA